MKFYVQCKRTVGRELWTGCEKLQLFHLCYSISGVCSWLSGQSANVSISKFLLAHFVPQIRRILSTQQASSSFCCWSLKQLVSFVRQELYISSFRSQVLGSWRSQFQNRGSRKIQMVGGRLQFCFPYINLTLLQAKACVFPCLKQMLLTNKV